MIWRKRAYPKAETVNFTPISDRFQDRTALKRAHSLQNAKAREMEKEMTKPARRLKHAMAASIALTCTNAPASAQSAIELGSVTFQTSCAQPSQQHFQTGLKLMHNMMYFQAEDLFEAAAVRDPDCAMLLWGVAMTKFQPLWPGRPSPEKIAEGPVWESCCTTENSLLRL